MQNMQTYFQRKLHSTNYICLFNNSITKKKCCNQNIKINPKINILKIMYIFQMYIIYNNYMFAISIYYINYLKVFYFYSI